MELKDLSESHQSLGDIHVAVAINNNSDGKSAASSVEKDALPSPSKLILEQKINSLYSSI